jgi:outer membrane protein OmpA-like peptidoglycan-associated protein
MKFYFSIFIVLCSVFGLGTCYAQNQFNINFGNNQQLCAAFNQAFQNRPKESSFAIKREGINLYFETNDEQWFNNLFRNPQDGIAIDVVDKERYSCDEISLVKQQIRGQLQKPIFSKQLKSTLEKIEDNKFRILVGRVPDTQKDNELEFNILFLADNSLCQYYVIYDLKAYAWDLLDMGIYLDSLTYNNKQISTNNDGYVLKNKTLKFSIPFEKNKSEYYPEDIKPLYDSLRLTDFNIKTINIKAYASVEGRLDRNIELQQQRAQSIARALQTFQTPSIETTISSSENWVEFLNDIQGTPYENLASLSKVAVKSRITGNFSEELEPILKNHRKAVVELELEKIDVYKNNTAEELLGKFKGALAVADVDEASKIQNAIFERLNGKEISPDFLRKMEIPQQDLFVYLINKQTSFNYYLDERQVLITHNQLKELEKLAPKDSRIKYNLVATKMKLWRYKALEVDANKFKTEISSLENYGIDAVLINRMMINYHIILAENYMRSRDFDNKDKSVSYINKNYNKVNLSNFDYLSLAQFFSYYGNTDMSTQLLTPKAKSIDVDEDLLFYYINLTIIDRSLTKTPDYRTIMLNAYNLNPERFCGLFDPYGQGGVTFQLLEDDFLRTTYCENCKN